MCGYHVDHWSWVAASVSVVRPDDALLRPCLTSVSRARDTDLDVALKIFIPLPADVVASQQGASVCSHQTWNAVGFRSTISVMTQAQSWT